MSQRARQSVKAKRRQLRARDRTKVVGYPKSLRRTWPRRKARAERAYRHAVRAALKGADIERAEPEPFGVRRKVAKKRPASTRGLTLKLAGRRKRGAKRYERRDRGRAGLRSRG